MEKKGALKLLVVLLIVSFMSACSKEKSDQIKLDPQCFQIFLSENSSSKSHIIWEESNIADKSKLLYDVFLNGKLKQKNRSLKKITFDNLEENVEYNVKVIAKSIYKTEKESFLIFKTLLDQVPKPLEFKVETISSTYIKLIWKKTSAEDMLNYDVYLDGKKLISGLDSEEFIFSNLQSKTSYTVRIVGINKFKKSSEISRKYTTIDFVEPEDFELSFSDITTEGIKLKWTIASSDDQLSSNITYNIFINGVKCYVNIPFLSYDLINLKENTKYTIEVEAVNKYGRSKKKGIIIKTKEFINTKMVSDFNMIVDSTGTKHIDLHFETTGDDNAVVVYDVMVDDEFIGRFLNKDVFTCANLCAETIYNFKIIARNSCDISRTKEKQLKTLAEPTLNDFEVISKEITTKSAILNWTKCIASDFSDVTYKVYDNNGILLVENLVSLEYKPKIILKSATTYNYKIVACHGNGELIREKCISFTTKTIPSVIDYKLLVTSEVYNIAKLSLLDFKIKNNSVFSDFSSFVYSIYIDDNKVYNGLYKEEIVFKDLEANSKHIIRLVIIHEDGSIVTDKNIIHLCGEMNSLEWSNNLYLESISSSYVLFNNIFAEYKMNKLKISKYIYYINGKPITDNSNVSGSGRVTTGVNDLNKRIYISNLDANSDYEFYIEAEDSNGIIIRTSTISFTTSPDILNLKVISGTNSYKIYWDKNGEANKIKDINIQIENELGYNMLYSKNIFFLSEYNNQFLLLIKKTENIDSANKLRIVIYWNDGIISKNSISQFLNLSSDK